MTTHKPSPTAAELAAYTIDGLAYAIGVEVAASDETSLVYVRELLRRYRAIEAERNTLVSAACAYIDRTANNSARDSTRERAALIALLPELGPMVWSDELQHYVRLPVEEVSRA